MRTTLLTLPLLALLAMTGCNQQSGSENKVSVMGDPYHATPTGFTTEAPKLKVPREDKETQLELARIKAEEKLELAKIEAAAKEEKARLELEAQKAKAEAEKEAKLHEHKIQKEIADSAQQTKKEIAAQKESTIIATQEKDISFYYIVTAVVAGLILVGLLIFNFIHRRNKTIEAKLQEEKLRHEEQMQASKQYHEKTTRILDMISSESTDPQIRNELVKILQIQEQNQMLLSAPKEEPKKDEENGDDDAQDAEVEEVKPS